VTADRDLFPVDELGMRAALVEGFRKRGIYPGGVSGLADEAVAWPSAADRRLPPLDREKIIEPLVMETASGYRSRRDPADPSAEKAYAEKQRARRETVAAVLQRYAKRHAAALGLQPTLPIQVQGFHAVFRMGGDGLLKVNVVAQLLQMAAKDVQAEMVDQLGGVVLRGGATVVADVDGEIRHVISRPTPVLSQAGSSDAGVARLAGIAQFVDQFDTSDLPGPWRIYDPDAKWPQLGFRQDLSRRVAASLSLGRLDRGEPW
jgi:hypothetical protein